MNFFLMFLANLGRNEVLFGIFQLTSVEFHSSIDALMESSREDFASKVIF
jgi:hypothetical protein